MKSRYSKRTLELNAACWRAYESGDRWVRIESKTTARMTGTALVWGGIAEFDPDSMVTPATGGAPYYGTRIRLSEETLNANGLTRRVRLFAGATFGRITEIQESIDDALAA